METYNTEKAVAFKSKGGQIIIIDHPAAVRIFHSCDGSSFTQYYSSDCESAPDLSGFSGTVIGADNRLRYFRREHLTASPALAMTFDGIVYSLVDAPRMIKYQPIPTTRQAEYLFSLANHTLFYVSSARFNGIWPMGDYRALLTGDPTAKVLNNVEVVMGERCNWGDKIITSAGTLWITQRRWVPFGWGREGLELAATPEKLEGFDIRDDEDDIVIRSRIMA